VGIEKNHGGFEINKDNGPGNIYYYKQEAKTNEQIRLEYFKKIQTKQKSQPIPIPKTNNYYTS